MATDVKLPELGEGVTEGELVKWLVKPGDSVKADQPIAEVLTDKATVEVPSPVAGVVKDVKFKAGDVVKVGSTMITLEAGAGATASAPAAKAAPAAQASTQSSSAAAAAAPPAPGAGKVQDVKLPELGEGVTEGELVKWLVKPGDSVKADQAIAEVLTDKATVEVPTPVAGVVKDVKFKTGDVVKVGSTMITLEGAGGATAAAAQPPAGAQREIPASAHANFAASSAPAQASTSTSSAPAGASAGIFPPVADSKVLATPATRRLAREMGVDINTLGGSGLAGRVTREDVMSAKGGAPAASQAGASAKAGGMTIPKPSYQGPAGAAEERVPLIGIRKKIAENMQRSKHVIPHFTIMDEAKVDAMVALREGLKEHAEKQGTKITYLPIVIKALIATIREFPMFNASIDDAAGEVVYKKYFNIGFAADTPNGLVVPVIKNADQKSILEISKEILDLSKRARDGKLKPDEMKGATITVTNIGSIGGTYATPVINHPEVAILGMYKIDEKPVIKNGQLAAIKVMNYTMTADHRLIDGAVAARFLAAFIARIENPGKLLVELV
ncbi:2-oxo acid dehydrogenase subunit E2 [Bdellovibrio reynosensis]|uniref:Dihydrolipoamide acetyltransferase component of pyruvate dehydrogenase complex n=1 Tax=Bdellovibrio reynosensis TaxID=2835041 RepID=A0ABY4C753_9BACT|nr:2-oxo acid dehydrogenase subunit E2 [Bdellovibrio reynosensis]UOE99746.1 2-oxo acid dehydrogenase subunit E2 [Bdellovibrio reynosensis]